MKNLRQFDLNLLVFFDALWTYQSVSGAAEHLNVTQPTVSAALNRLRTHFDDQLFVWDGHTMAPTAKTMSLVPQVEAIIQRAQLLDSAADFDALKVHRNFVIASTDYVFALFMPPLLATLKQKAPNIKITLVEFKPFMGPRMGTPDIDLTILPQSALPSSNVKEYVLYRDDYVVITDEEDSAPPLTAETFFTRPQIKFSADTKAIIDHETQHLRQNQQRMNIALTVDHYLMIPRLIRGSDNFAICPRKIQNIPGTLDGLRLQPPPVSIPDLDLTLAWDNSRHKDPVNRFIRDTLIARGQAIS
ncbi:MAG: hypothetical protein CMF31_01005 [Kordiimonas sp.]|nr:hypothetical protein [Kordiimonas sp.]